MQLEVGHQETSFPDHKVYQDLGWGLLPCFQNNFHGIYPDLPILYRQRERKQCSANYHLRYDQPLRKEKRRLTQVTKIKLT